MTISDARTLANVNARSQRLHEDGYRARRLPRLLRGKDGGYLGDHDLVQVLSPQGEDYEVALPTGILEKVERICPDFLPAGKVSVASPDIEAEWLDLSAELTARQEEFNMLGIGRCTCQFWWHHSGRYWCKHYLGAPLLLLQEKRTQLERQLAQAVGLVEAIRSGCPLRLCAAKGGIIHAELT